MAIVENRSSEIGDILRIKTQVPIVGIVSLFSFLDSTENESSPNKIFDKHFRYSVDGGVNFTEWFELTSINISSISVERKDSFVIEYKYERSGSDSSGELVWNSTNLSGTIEPVETPIYNRSLFKKFFDVNDPNVLGWAINVLEKLYNNGILPKYITRSNDEYNPIESDKDFLNFFNTTTHFFAIIVYYARQFRDLRGNKILTREFLLSRGIVLPFDENIEDMVYILDNYVDEYKKRGTSEIYRTKDSGSEVDGEMLRLINYKEDDEFIFALLKNSESGWCIGKSSPMWSSAKNITNAIKGYEFTTFVEDLSKYPLIEESYISLENIVVNNVGSGNAITISNILGSGIVECGVGSETPNEDFLIKIDGSLDYEISFKVKVDVVDSQMGLNFGISAFDSQLNETTLTTTDTLTPSNFFVEDFALKTDSFYSFRGCLFSKNKTVSTSLKPTFKGGNYLKMSGDIKYIIPKITVSDTATSNIKYSIYDIKVTPLNLPFTQGQLGVRQIIATYLKNDGGFSDMEIKEFCQRFLVPYNTYLKIKTIN